MGDITVTMPVTKETPKTFRFDADHDSAAVRNIYVSQSAFGDKKPKAVEVTVRPIY